MAGCAAWAYDGSNKRCAPHVLDGCELFTSKHKPTDMELCLLPAGPSTVTATAAATARAVVDVGGNAALHSAQAAAVSQATGGGAAVARPEGQTLAHAQGGGGSAAAGSNAEVKTTCDLQLLHASRTSDKLCTPCMCGDC
jgi:hypothetical protein